MKIKITKKGKEKNLAKKCPSCNSTTFRKLDEPQKALTSMPIVITHKCFRKGCDYAWGIPDER